MLINQFRGTWSCQYQKEKDMGKVGMDPAAAETSERLWGVGPAQHRDRGQKR